MKRKIDWNGKEALGYILFTKRIVTKLLNTFIKCYPWYGGKTSGYWENRDYNDKRGIRQYLELSPTSIPLIEEVVMRAEKNDRILDLCCNVGRHANELEKRGFREVHGVDINKGCANYALNSKVKYVWEPVQEYFAKIDNNYYDIVFTHGATIEYIHPKFKIVENMCRVTKKYVIMANINMNRVSYPRFWIYEFEKNGFALIKLLQPEKEWSPNSKQNRPTSMLVFERINQN